MTDDTCKKALGKVASEYGKVFKEVIKHPIDSTVGAITSDKPLNGPLNKDSPIGAAVRNAAKHCM
jgi:uncharacterized protein